MKKVISTAFLGIISLAFVFATNPATIGDEYQIGDKIEDFSLKNIDGTMISLSDYGNVEGYVIVFTCNTCPWAVKYEDRLIALHNKTVEQGFPVVAIMPNDPDVKPGDSFEAMKQRAADKGFPFKYLMDEGQHVFPRFGATRTPQVFLVDKDMVLRYIGAIDDNAQDASAIKINYVEDAIAKIKAGEDPYPNTTKAIGCSIKVKS
jgi:peroxiredoxin